MLIVIYHCKMIARVKIIREIFLRESMVIFFFANIYLGEDHILCWKPVFKRSGSWILHYVKLAYAVMDAPDQFLLLSS